MVIDCPPTRKIKEVRMGNYSLIWSGLKGRAHTRFVAAWIANKSMEAQLSPALNRSSVIWCLIWMQWNTQQNNWFLHGTATYTAAMTRFSIPWPSYLLWMPPLIFKWLLCQSAHRAIEMVQATATILCSVGSSSTRSNLVYWNLWCTKKVREYSSPEKSRR